MINHIGDMLKAIMERKKISSSELARCTGIAQPVIYRIASGETDNPKINTLIPIANYFKISLDELINGSASGGNGQAISDFNSAAQQQKIPLFTLDVLSNKTAHHASEWFSAHTRTSASSFCVKISDDSFLPNFPVRTIMIFEPDIEPRNGDIILVSHKNEPLSIKKLLIDGGDFYLKPIRAELSAKPIAHKSDLEIMGVLVETASFYRKNLEDKE